MAMATSSKSQKKGVDMTKEQMLQQMKEIGNLLVLGDKAEIPEEAEEQDTSQGDQQDRKLSGKTDESGRKSSSSSGGSSLIFGLSTEFPAEATIEKDVINSPGNLFKKHIASTSSTFTTADIYQEVGDIPYLDPWRSLKELTKENQQLDKINKEDLTKSQTKIHRHRKLEQLGFKEPDALLKLLKTSMRFIPIENNAPNIYGNYYDEPYLFKKPGKIIELKFESIEDFIKIDYVKEEEIKRNYKPAFGLAWPANAGSSSFILRQTHQNMLTAFLNYFNYKAGADERKDEPYDPNLSISCAITAGKSPYMKLISQGLENMALETNLPYSELPAPPEVHVHTVQRTSVDFTPPTFIAKEDIKFEEIPADYMSIDIALFPDLGLTDIGIPAGAKAGFVDNEGHFFETEAGDALPADADVGYIDNEGTFHKVLDVESGIQSGQIEVKHGYANKEMVEKYKPESPQKSNLFGPPESILGGSGKPPKQPPLNLNPQLTPGYGDLNFAPPVSATSTATNVQGTQGEDADATPPTRHAADNVSEKPSAKVPKTRALDKAAPQSAATTKVPEILLPHQPIKGPDGTVLQQEASETPTQGQATSAVPGVPSGVIQPKSTASFVNVGMKKAFRTDLNHPPPPKPVSAEPRKKKKKKISVRSVDAEGEIEEEIEEIDLPDESPFETENLAYEVFEEQPVPGARTSVPGETPGTTMVHVVPASTRKSVMQQPYTETDLKTIAPANTKVGYLDKSGGFIELKEKDQQVPIGAQTVYKDNKTDKVTELQPKPKPPILVETTNTGYKTPEGKFVELQPGDGVPAGVQVGFINADGKFEHKQPKIGYMDQTAGGGGKFVELAPGDKPPPNVDVGIMDDESKFRPNPVKVGYKTPEGNFVEVKPGDYPPPGAVVGYMTETGKFVEEKQIPASAEVGFIQKGEFKQLVPPAKAPAGTAVGYKDKKDKDKHFVALQDPEKGFFDNKGEFQQSKPEVQEITKVPSGAQIGYINEESKTFKVLKPGETVPRGTTIGYKGKDGQFVKVSDGGGQKVVKEKKIAMQYVENPNQIVEVEIHDEADLDENGKPKIKIVLRHRSSLAPPADAIEIEGGGLVWREGNEEVTELPYEDENDKDADGKAKIKRMRIRKKLDELPEAVGVPAAGRKSQGSGGRRPRPGEPGFDQYYSEDAEEDLREVPLTTEERERLLEFQRNISVQCELDFIEGSLDLGDVVRKSFRIYSHGGSIDVHQHEEENITTTSTMTQADDENGDGSNYWEGYEAEEEDHEHKKHEIKEEKPSTSKNAYPGPS